LPPAEQLLPPGIARCSSLLPAAAAAAEVTSLRSRLGRFILKEPLYTNEKLGECCWVATDENAKGLRGILRCFWKNFAQRDEECALLCRAGPARAVQPLPLFLNSIAEGSFVFFAPLPQASSVRPFDTVLASVRDKRNVLLSLLHKAGKSVLHGLHDQGFVCRSLSLHSFVVVGDARDDNESNISVLLADVSHAKLAGTTAPPLPQEASRYAAPETAAPIPAAASMDVWSFACIVLEALSGAPLQLPPAADTLPPGRPALTASSSVNPCLRPNMSQLLRELRSEQQQQLIVDWPERSESTQQQQAKEGCNKLCERRDLAVPMRLLQLAESGTGPPAAAARFVLDALCGSELEESIVAVTLLAFRDDIDQWAPKVRSVADTPAMLAAPSPMREAVKLALRSVASRLPRAEGMLTLAVARPWDDLAQALVFGQGAIGSREHGPLGSGFYFTTTIVHASDAAAAAGAPSVYMPCTSISEQPTPLLVGLAAVQRAFPAVFSDSPWLKHSKKPPTGYDAVFGLVQHRWPILSGARGWWPLVPEDWWQSGEVCPSLCLFSHEQFLPLFVLHFAAAPPESHDGNGGVNNDR